ncbi:MAG: hypothetical protein FJ279_24715 [Planctomycetes bacterium]|nr:hypothetical protein [Planctomycetota bacterium]
MTLDLGWARAEDIQAFHNRRTDACVAFYRKHDAFAKLKASIPRLEPAQWALYTHAIVARRNAKPVGYALVDLDFQVKSGKGGDLLGPEAAVEPVCIVKEMHVLHSDPAPAQEIRRALLDFALDQAKAHGVKMFYVDRTYASDEVWMQCLQGLGFGPDATFHVMRLDLGA